MAPLPPTLILIIDHFRSESKRVSVRRVSRPTSLCKIMHGRALNGLVEVARRRGRPSTWHDGMCNMPWPYGTMDFHTHLVPIETVWA